MTKPIFHVGYGKSGSTTLQVNVFMRHPDIFYAGIPIDKSDLNIQIDSDSSSKEKDERSKKLASYLFKTDSVNFDQEKTNQLLQEIQEQAQADDVFMMSDESATASIYSYPDIIEKAKRIKRTFGDVKILMVIREQRAVLKSMYRMCPFDTRPLHYGSDVVTFPEWLKIEINKKYFSCLDALNYGHIIEHYFKIFGQENVLVLPLELLKEDKNKFCTSLAEFCNIDVSKTLELLDTKPQNTGFSSRYNTYRKLRHKINIPIFTFIPERWKSVIKSWLKRGKPENLTIPKEIEDTILARFSKGNRALEKKLGFKLQEYGYTVKEVKMNGQA